MGTMQSTLERIASEEAQAAAPADSGWKPAGPPLMAGGDMVGDVEMSPGHIVSAPADVSRETSLPSVGHIVVYHLREGDSRNRRVKFPALVMDSDPELGLRLWVVVDDGDTWTQERVQPRRGPEAGWELPESAPVYLPPGIFSEVLAQLETARAEIDRVTGISGDLLLRVEALEAKRPPGRPKKA